MAKSNPNPALIAELRNAAKSNKPSTDYVESLTMDKAIVLPDFEYAGEPEFLTVEEAEAINLSKEIVTKKHSCRRYKYNEYSGERERILNPLEAAAKKRGRARK